MFLNLAEVHIIRNKIVKQNNSDSIYLNGIINIFL